ncbi:MAG: 3-oxoacyl-acyl-carrier-protein synthase II [Puniceicoccaceae bacterium 5H]|nr:MAG: 3-oxoacyl-acyl-carrier-protein synthase II [Puniceicoccaceae bacterium 5H]
MSTVSKHSRIVVTGLGALTPLGNNVDEYWDGLKAGRSGIGRVEGFDVSEMPCQVGGEVKGFNPADHMDVKESRKRDRYTQLAVAASRQAYVDAGLDTAGLDPFRIGCLVGSGIGGIDTIEKQNFRMFEGGARKISPFMVPMIITNMASGIVAIDLNLKGPNYGIVSACATATHSIADAMRMLQLGEADVMLAGGAEASVTRLGFGGFCSMKAMSTSFNDTPQQASRPFDKDRDGFVMGEGSGVLVLETLEHAQKRGAKIYCELLGHASTCDAFHITSPDPDGTGLKVCLQNALKSAGLQPEEVDYINAHGTSTPYNDKGETLAIKAVWGEDAKRLKISSTKSMTGHLLGAAGGIEAIACIKTITDGIIPPTINYTTPDPDCDLDYVPNQAVEQPVRVAMSSNLGFGGHNGVVVFRKLED